MGPVSGLTSDRSSDHVHASSHAISHSDKSGATISFTVAGAASGLREQCHRPPTSRLSSRLVSLEAPITIRQGKPTQKREARQYYRPGGPDYFRLVKGVASSLQRVVDKAAKTSKRSSISVEGVKSFV